MHKENLNVQIPSEKATQIPTVLIEHTVNVWPSAFGFHLQ